MPSASVGRSAGRPCVLTSCRPLWEGSRPRAASGPHTGLAETRGRTLGASLILFIVLFCVTTPCYLDSLFVVG